MTWDSRYLPPDNKLWQGRPDLVPNACYFQIIQVLNLLEQIPPITNKRCFALVGFCCDEGIRRNFGRTGAMEGPFAIREALAKLAIAKYDFICYDAGDIICPDGNLETAQAALAEIIALLLEHHITPIVLGGGHELAWGQYQGIIKKNSRERLGIVSFDAHFDMRKLLNDKHGTSGTSFLQIAQAHLKAKRRFDYTCIGIQQAANIPKLFSVAEDFHTHFISAEDIFLADDQRALTLVDRAIEQNDLLYVSTCLDVFSSAYAPGVSAPQVLGLTPWQTIPLLRQLAASQKVVSYDFAEVSPKYDVDHRTAKLAANLIAIIIHYHQ